MFMHLQDFLQDHQQNFVPRVSSMCMQYLLHLLIKNVNKYFPQTDFGKKNKFLMMIDKNHQINIFFTEYPLTYKNIFK